MNSCLYKSEVMHRRTAPKRHSFKYRLFMFYLDLDEIESLDRSYNFIGHNRFAPYEFRDDDHYNPSKTDLKTSIRNYLREQGIEDPVGKIHLLTHLRTWGHLFNPVSFYFVTAQNGSPICSIAEVGNTFNEQKLFIVKSQTDGRSHTDTIKNFYVSPFSELDTQFHFKIATPREHMRIAISQSKNGETYFNSVLTGGKSPLTGKSLLMSALQFPLLTLKIVGAIHWQALRLYLKGVPYFRKSENPHLQTNTHPYLTKETYEEH